MMSHQLPDATFSPPFNSNEEDDFLPRMRGTKGPSYFVAYLNDDGTV